MNSIFKGKGIIVGYTAALLLAAGLAFALSALPPGAGRERQEAAAAAKYKEALVLMDGGSMDEALGLLKSVRQWKVIEAGVLSPRDDYEAQVRMRLDVTQLPKPFQVNAITSREWNLASDWRELAVPAELAR